ncbi:MAG: hypothetical protein CMD18_05535 [Flavobacteriales bacterium]|nr:hypothetical protein [Flavobacteriales bacterium]|tara:strand:- start:1517 stop:2023 length:507 start_codon:yes stop_codon:yes gene_type:complete
MIKKSFSILGLTILFIIIYSCQNDVLYVFKVSNSSDKDVIFIEYSSNQSINDTIEILIQGHQDWSYPRDKRDPDPFESFIQEDYYVTVIFSDGKKLTYHNEIDVLDSLGNLYTLPQRIQNSDTTLLFPIDGINNIFSKNGWSKNCNNKRKKVCTYEFEITKECYSYAR